MFDAALGYASRGWHVFPCWPRDKRPLTPNGFHDATLDPETLRAWWTTSPDANVAVATGPSGLLVIDVDAAEEKPGAESLTELEAEHGRLPDTLVAWTPSGGLHLFYELPPDTAVPCSTGRIGRGIDVRAHGGYVVVPPSVHPVYRDVPYLWPDPNAAVVPAPDWLVALCAKPAPPARAPEPAGLFSWTRFRSSSGYGDAALRGEVTRVESAPEGTRNATLNAAAFAIGQLVAAGAIEPAVAVSALLGAGLRAGLDDSEVRRTITSGMESGIAQPRAVAS